MCSKLQQDLASVLATLTTSTKPLSLADLALVTCVVQRLEVKVAEAQTVMHFMREYSACGQVLGRLCLLRQFTVTEGVQSLVSTFHYIANNCADEKISHWALNQLRYLYTPPSQPTTPPSQPTTPSSQPTNIPDIIRETFSKITTCKELNKIETELRVLYQTLYRDVVLSELFNILPVRCNVKCEEGCESLSEEFVSEVLTGLVNGDVEVTAKDLSKLFIMQIKHFDLYFMFILKNLSTAKVADKADVCKVLKRVGLMELCRMYPMFHDRSTSTLQMRMPSPLYDMILSVLGEV